ncbi:putative xylanase/chitin deacetylase [Opitutaceae bacterium TAV1]|nr:putative xylanase/chitin deacetylase [Opitutaceae bacterium TAV1]
MKTRLAVLTFDDAVRNHATFIAPLLHAHGFGATFYVTEFAGENGDRFDTDKRQYMTWEQIRALDAAGFEIGNHTGTHAILRGLSSGAMEAEVALIERRCREHGIAAPTTFCHPCGEADDDALAFLRGRGYGLARATGDRPHDPASDDPLRVPSFVITDAEPGGVEAALAATEERTAHTGRTHVAVLTLHGVPDRNHPWVSLSRKNFAHGLAALKAGGWTVVAMRDLHAALG